MADLFCHVLKEDKSINYGKACWDNLRQIHSSPRRPGFIRHFDYLNNKYVYMEIPEYKSKSSKQSKKTSLEKTVEKNPQTLGAAPPALINLSQSPQAAPTAAEMEVDENRVGYNNT